MAKDLRALPKGHLHYHLELCMRQSTLDDLCSEYGVQRATTQLATLPRHPASYDRGGGFSSFDEFGECAGMVLSLVRSADDLSRIILEMAADARADGVAYIEPSFGCAEKYAQTWAASPRAAWDVGLAAGREAEARTGVVVRWMSPANRTRPPGEALAQARLAAELVATSEPVVSFGLHGSEGATTTGDGPFPPEPFQAAFQVAAGAGLVSTPHAGEHMGPMSCVGAVNALGAQRLQHGVRAAEDSAAMALLARNRVCCDVCPSSNVQLNVYDTLESHPLPKLMAAGVPCSLNCDDSTLFGASIVDEYSLARTSMGLSDAMLAQCARDSLEYSGLMCRAKLGGALSGADQQACSRLRDAEKSIAAWETGPLL
eukprot:COSAG02_NODE_9409_length_2226_cov_1.488011_3_plen_372_part_00